MSDISKIIGVDIATIAKINNISIGDIGSVGGADIPSGFTPTGTPYAWYDSEALVYSDNDEIILWPDSSGNNRPLNVVGGDKAVYKENIKNSLPIARFTNDWIERAWGETLAQPNTVFIVCKLANTGQSNNYIFDGEDVGRNAFMVFSGNFAMHATVSILQGSAEDTNWHVFSMQYNGASSILRMDGGNQVQGAGGASGSDGLTLGNPNNHGTGFVGDIGEIIFYNGAESFTNNEAGLMAKWGL